MTLYLLLAASLLLNLIGIFVAIVYARNRGGIGYVLVRLRLRPHFHSTPVEAPTETVKAGDVVFVGDSLTEGAPLAEFFGNGRVVNCAVGGSTSADVLAHIDRIASAQPSKIFLWIGVNDLGQDIPVRVLMTNYRAILEKIRDRSPQSRVFVQSILPGRTLPGATYGKGKLDDANAQLRALAQEFGHAYIDLIPAFADAREAINPAYVTEDGLHLSTRGYGLWLRLVADHVAATPTIPNI